MAAASVSNKKVGVDLTEGSILKGLLMFALPLVMTNVIQQLYSMVDLMVIGKFVGNHGTVGVSVGGEVADLVTPVATAFAIAGQVYIAQLFGAKKDSKMKQAIGTLLTIMILMSLATMAVTIVFCIPILNVLNCPAEAEGQAISYMVITAIGMPAIFGYNAVCGILRGLGEGKRPLVFIIVAAVTNIFLDIILVVFFQMEAAGTAIATAVAQYGSFIAAFYYMEKNKEQFEFELKLSYFKIDRESAMIIVKQGMPQAIRAMFVRFSILWVNSNINSYGLIASATNSVGNKIQKFMDVFTAGVTSAAGAMVGQNLGAKKQDRAAKTIWYTLGSTLVIASCLGLMAWFIPRQVFSIFSNDAEVLEFGVTFMHIMIFHFLFSAITSSFQSMVIGSGYASMNFMVGILDGVICKVGLSILFASVMGMGVVGYFWAVGFSRALPGVICCIFFLSGKWKKRKLLSE